MLDGDWAITIMEYQGQTTYRTMRFRIEGIALQCSVYNQETGSWSGYAYLGTLQNDAFTYETTGQLHITSNNEGECICKANVTTQKEWIFSNNQLICRIFETTTLVLGTPETCPQWVFKQLPTTKTTIWTGCQIPESRS